MAKKKATAKPAVKPKQVPVKAKAPEKQVKESKWSTKLLRQGLVPTLSNYAFGPAGSLVSAMTPFNARQVMAAFLTGDSNFSLKDAPEGVQRELYNSIANANKKYKDKSKGEFRGTEYKDYSPEMHETLRNLRGSTSTVMGGSLLSDDFNAATTFGRVSYKDNPETNSYDVYDNYDFTATDNKTSPYAKFRSAVGDFAKGTPLDPTGNKQSNYIGSFNKKEWDNSSNSIPNVSLPTLYNILNGKENKTKKKENGGWLSKYDVPEAQNGIEGTMGGLTDKGFNYNGAWGGPSMQMGGSIPGTVGFSYARTQSPAPSKGKYAKKTMASAQNGQEMKFYQEGLDWTPKTISRDGSSLPQAQGGKQLTTEEQAIVQDRKNRIKASLAARENGNYTKDNWRQQLAEESQAIGDKFRIFPDDPNSIIDEYFNPGVTIGNMAADLGSAPLRAQQEDSYLPYVTSVGSPILTGALEGWNVKSNKQFAKNIINPFNFPGQETVKKVLGKGVNKVSKAAGSFKKDFMQGYKQIPTREDGGIIEDDRGQWEFPGEITKINSNEITMQGVDYPVLGISDTGDTQMMQPGQDYTYEGKSVTEYPMMKDGGSTSSTITCPNCGWSWKRSEAGNDPYVCHKCGTNNASKIQSIKKENGGWLSKYN